MKIPVSACMITKNDPLIFDAIKSIREYTQEIVVVDTGSTKEYQDQIRPLVDIFEVCTKYSDPQTGLIDNFASVRARSFELATNKWCYWLDSDDQLEGIQELQRIIAYGESIKHQFDAIAFMFPYEYAYDNNNECILRHYRERLISNKNYFAWRNSVHEVLCKYPDTANVNFIQDDSIIWKHRRQFSPKPAEPGRNLRILKKYIQTEEGKDDARQYYYIGLEYANNGLAEEAIQSLTKYIDMSGWDDERNMACLKLVDIYQAKNQLQEGLKWAFKAIEICETWAEGYFALGRMFYLLAQQGGPNQLRYWQRCAHFIKLGFTMPPTKTLLFVNPLEREHEIHKYLNVALNSIGDVRGALDSCNTGLKRKDDPMLAGNKKLYEKFLINQQIFGALEQLKTSEYIKPEAADLISNIINDKVSVSELLKPKAEVNNFEFTPCGMPGFLPLGVIKDPLQSKLNESLNKEGISNEEIGDGKGKLDIVFMTGPAISPWNPKTIKESGNGGSEILCAEMAERLHTQMGHKVRVYCMCGEEGNYNGVEYLQWEKYHDLNCDVLIVSRRADFLEDHFNVKSKLTLLWTHDIYPSNSTNVRLLKSDRILALSDWHKNYIIETCNVHPEHIIQTRNAIDFNLFNKQIKRDQYKVINASSPDRSWPILLQNWPRIKTRVPQATLHLFYGFEGWRYAAQNDSKQMDLINYLEQQIKNMSGMGVIYHGRVNQETLAEHMLSAGVMAHPTFFTETFGINFVSAQMAGMRIITSNCGALQTTVGNRGILLDGEWTSQQYQDEFVENVVRALIYDDNSDRIELQKYAREHFGFDELVSNWDKMFYDLIELKKTNPIIPYFPTKSYR